MSFALVGVSTNFPGQMVAHHGDNYPSLSQKVVGSHFDLVSDHTPTLRIANWPASPLALR